MPQLIIPANWNLPLRPFKTKGPPESPSQESFPPFEVPAHKNILGIHSFCPDSLYICMHLLFDMIGKWTSLRTGEIWPYSDRRPHPVTLPVFPTRSESDWGKQIGMIFGWNETGATILSNAISYSYEARSKLECVTSLVILRSTCGWASLPSNTLYSPTRTNKLDGARSFTQCAAVIIHWWVRRAAPHLCRNCPFLYCRKLLARATPHIERSHHLQSVVHVGE